MTVERTRYVASLLVTKINSGTFSQTATAERRYLDDTDYDRATEDSWFVPVIPAARQDTISSKCTTDLAFDIDVGFVKKVSDTATATVDACMDFVGEVCEWLQKAANRNLGSNYTVVSVNIAPLYIDEQLRENSTFVSRVTVRVIKTIAIT